MPFSQRLKEGLGRRERRGREWIPFRFLFVMADSLPLCMRSLDWSTTICCASGPQKAAEALSCVAGDRRMVE